MESHGTLRTWPPGARTRVSLASAAGLATTPPKRRNLPPPRAPPRLFPEIFNSPPDKLQPCPPPRSCARAWPLCLHTCPALQTTPNGAPPPPPPPSPTHHIPRTCLPPRAHAPATTPQLQRAARNGHAGALPRFPRFPRISASMRRAAAPVPPLRSPARQLSIEQSASALRPAVREISPFYCTPSHSPPNHRTVPPASATSTPKHTRTEINVAATSHSQDIPAITSHVLQYTTAK